MGVPFADIAHLMHCLRYRTANLLLQINDTALKSRFRPKAIFGLGKRCGNVNLPATHVCNAKKYSAGLPRQPRGA